MDQAMGPQQEQGPFDITGNALDRLVLRVRSDLARAKGRKTKLNAQAKRYRKIIDLQPKNPPYEGAPDITLPLTRAKRDGVVSHLTDALDVEPLYSAKPLTAEAASVAPIWEALMEKELIDSGGREQVLATVPESADVGTAILGWSIALNARGEPVIQESLTKFENFFAYPVSVDDFTNASTFRFYKDPWFVLDRMVKQNLLDREGVDELRGGGGTGENLTYEEERDGNRDSEFSNEQELHSLWECYVRWNGELWRVVFSERLNRALSAKRNPFREAFDAPPYEPIRVMKKPGYVWGHAVPQLLEAIQKLMDNAENSRMAYNQFAISPVIMADRMNPFTQQVRGGGLAPGMVIETMGPPQANGVEILEFPAPQVTVQDMELAQRFADLATFTDFQMQGAPFASSRRTATEVRTSFNVGTLKLRSMLRDLREDLSRAARKRWALIELFKVKPAGVMQVYREGKQYLLADEDLDASYMGIALQQFQMAEGISPQEMVDINRINNVYQLVDGSIPGVKRDDIRWQPNGSDVIPDKVAELQKLDSFAPFLNFLGAAQQDGRIWYFLKLRLQLMGRHDWQKLIGEEPPNAQMEPNEFAQTMQMLTEQSSQLQNMGAQ